MTMGPSFLSSALTGMLPKREHVEDIRDVQLVAERKADHVHAGEGGARFEGEEGDAAASSDSSSMSGQGAKQRSHHTPSMLLSSLVEKKKTEIGHAYLVDVGVAEGDAHGSGAALLHHPSRLDPEVPRGPRDV